ncbi:MAG TPA: PepSY-associated TM helix domain-containing protein, partial [Candidatus Bathyarchaeia archaeon]|nr:PepSY-associated TM helix domain-containing protein [Candidatus Bathyarchaeia archaeon]
AGGVLAMPTSRSGKIARRVHAVAVFLHRWVGLTMTVFLIIVGITGSLLAFRTDLERWINPQLFAGPKPGQTSLDLATLAEKAEAIAPYAKVGYFSVERDQAVMSMVPRTDPATGKPHQLDFNHLFLDPYTGKELGRRRDGDLRQGRINTVPFVYDLHATLTLGSTGGWILGIVALAWTLDGFVGFYLTLPRAQGGFWRRWKYAWGVKWRASSFRVNFDLHRAGGLWFWLLVFVFAWSSVMLTLRSVYVPVTKALFDYRSDEQILESVMRPEPLDTPKLDWRAAQTAGEKLMAQQAELHGFSITRPYGMAYIPAFGVYTYAVRSSLDIRGHGWDTSVWVDGDTGALRDVGLPSGQHAGNTVSTWLWGLHYGDIRDFLPYRILVCVFGIVLTMLSVTGVYIWWKKRRARALGVRQTKRLVAELDRREASAPQLREGA